MAVIRNVDELRAYFGLNAVLIGDLPIDVLRSETPVYDYDLTEHPVESGFDITDARIERPIGVTLECILTDTDLSARAVGTAALNDTLGYDSWKDKRDRLYEIRDSSEVLDVVTPLDRYESMTITSLRVDQTPGTASALFFRVDLREVRFVSSIITGVDDAAVPKKKKAKKPDNNADKKTKEEVNKGTKQTKQKSLLLQGIEFFTGA
jgi:hypothetical protein